MEIAALCAIDEEEDVSGSGTLDLSLVVQLRPRPRFVGAPSQIQACIIRLADLSWRVGFNPFAVIGLVFGLVLVCYVIVVLW